MDQHKEVQQQQQQEEEEDHSKESTDQRKEEEKEMDNAEEPMDQNKEEKSSEEVMDPHKVAAAAAEEEEEEQEEERSSESEEAMAAWSVFAHPCSLLQYMVRACATWLWLPESLCGTKPSAASHAPADSPQEREEDTKTSTTGFYMHEVITRSRAVLKVRRPTPPGNPREGSGGNGGHHH